MWRPLLTVLVLLTCAGCTPEKPDVIEARREAAQGRLAGAELVSKQVVTQEKLSNRLAKEQEDIVVAKIGEKVVTVGDVVRHIDNEGVETRSLYMIPQNRRDLVNQMIEKELMVAEAEKAGLGRHPVVQHAWKKAMVLEYLRKFGSQMTIADVSDESAKAYYEANKARYQTQEKRRASVLIVGLKAESKRIRGELMKAIEESPVQARQIFADFVKRYTEHESTKLVNGNLGWFDVEGNPEGRRIPPEAGSVSQAFALTENAISESYVSEGGHTLLQLTGIRPQKTRAFEDVKMDIKLALLTAEKSTAIKKMIGDIVAKAKVTVDEAALEALGKAITPTDPGAGSQKVTPTPKPIGEAAQKPIEPTPRTAPTPRGVPHPMLLKRPTVTSPKTLRGKKPINPSNHSKTPALSRDEIREKMGAKDK